MSEGRLTAREACVAMGGAPPGWLTMRSGWMLATSRRCKGKAQPSSGVQRVEEEAALRPRMPEPPWWTRGAAAEQARRQHETPGEEGGEHRAG